MIIAMIKFTQGPFMIEVFDQKDDVLAWARAARKGTVCHPEVKIEAINFAETPLGFHHTTHSFFGPKFRMGRN